MPKIVLDDKKHGVHLISVTAEAVRSTFEGTSYQQAFGKEWETLLDEAQSEVTGGTSVAYVVIQIRK